MSKIKLSDFVAKYLKERYNVKHFFMVSGGGAMHLNDSLGRYINYTANHHEQACAIAAEGYSRLQGDTLSVVNVTTGPGGLNTLNGVFGQWTDSVPVLYISGQVKIPTTMQHYPNLDVRQLGDQEVDIISVVKPLTKYAKMVTDKNEIKYHIDKAIYEATTGRFGPVWLDIPIDIQASIIEEDDLIEFKPQNEHLLLDFNDSDCESALKKLKAQIDKNTQDFEKCQPLDLHVSDCESALKKLVSAKKPLIVCGHGIRLSNQIENFYKLVDMLKVPVVTTFNGFDIMDDNNPYYIGRIGTVGQRAGNFALQNSDCVLFLGTRNNIRQASYNYENFAKNAFKIVVDIDKNELYKPTVDVDLAINADLKMFIPKIIEKLKADDYKANYSPKWLEFAQELKNKYSFEKTKEYSQNENEAINPYYFIRQLTNELDENDVIIMANGSACVCTYQVAKVKRNQRYILNSGNASMGYDLPCAIGACVKSLEKDDKVKEAHKHGRIICIAGDGSIMMNLQELETIKYNKLPIKLFVLNNSGYSSIRQTQRNFFKGHMTGSGNDSGVSVPQFYNIAKGFNLNAIRIDSALNLNEKIKQVLKTDGFILCEAVLQKEYSFSPKLSSRKLADGTMVSPSLEDMFPFISREEYQENIFQL